MADPFSVTGSAVGIVSLGITACKGLIWYIDNAKDAKEKTSQVSDRLDILVDHLELLQKVIGELGPSQCVTATTLGITACATAIDSIHKRLGRKSSSQPDRSPLRKHLRGLKQRFSYPFKQEEIIYCKNVLEDIQQDLQTALAALQLDQQRKDFESIRLQIAHDTRLAQLSRQTIIDQQESTLEYTSMQLKNQTELIRAGFQASKQQFSAIQQDVDRLQNSISPLSGGVSHSSTLLSNIEASVNRLEAKLDILTPESISPDSLLSDFAECRAVSREFKTLKQRTALNAENHLYCNCSGRTQKTVFLEWPIHFSKTQKTVHNSNCPQALYQHSATELNVRLSVCSLTLKRKIHVALAVSQVAGVSSIVPSLICYRVVPETSPAFALIGTLHKRELKAYSEWKRIETELLHIFEKREASPYDRLDDGKTLVHYLLYLGRDSFGTHELSHFRYFVRQLAQYIGDLVLEKDDWGFTCLDFMAMFIPPYHDHVNEFLRIGVRFSLDFFMHNHLLSQNQAFEDPEIFTESSEYMAMIVARSESGLRSLLRRCGSINSISATEGSSLYNIATKLAWRRGCEILHAYKVSFAETSTNSKTTDSRQRIFHSPLLLEVAVKTRDIEILQFWIDIRSELDAQALQQVGTLENAFDEAIFIARNSPEIVDTVLAAIVQQRKTLKSIADTYLVAQNLFQQPEGLLDVNSQSVVDDLMAKGVDVHPSLIPARGSIYRMHLISPGLLDKIYNAGFRDISIASFRKLQLPGLPPLHYHLSRLSMYCRVSFYLETANWFISKGASLHEDWPDSQAKAIHIIGWVVGYKTLSESIRMNLPSKYTTNFQHNAELHPFFEDRFSDGCICACSTAGCIFITTFGKGFLESLSERYRKPNYLRLWDEAMYIFATHLLGAIQATEHRRLVSEFIRFFVFSRLDIRHTCCTIERTSWSVFDEEISPRSPRYSPDVTARILEEDAHLLDLLEKLVDEFEKEYDSFEASPVDFVNEKMIPRLNQVLEELGKEDREMFEEKRRQMGIVMEYGNKSGDTDLAESEEAEEKSSDDEF